MRLEIDNVVTKRGHLPALNGVTLYVDGAEIVAVLGANGAGKSTLARSILGIDKVSSGDIRVDGASLLGLNTTEIVARGLSLVPEGRALFPKLSVWQHLQLSCYSGGKSHLAQKADEIFELFPRLAERRRQVAGTLSGGEQQVLAIARALVQDPKLLILDEPSLGLASNLYEFILDKIQEINRRGCSVLLIEQKISQALSISHRGYILNLGRVEKEGAAEDLLNDQEVRQIYLGADVGKHKMSGI